MTTESYDEAAVRAEVRTWLAEHWDLEITVREWWARLADSGWGFPSWPTEWFGRGLPPDADGVVVEELIRAGALGAPAGAGTSMGAPVLFRYGTDEQKQRWLPPLVRGEEYWGQFFSEPGAGSDLAGVQCRAVRDGDEWIVNGQKVWNSGTINADRALLVARTDIDVPKHKGIGFFIIDVHQPGIDVRPIRQMNGRQEFNETFLTDARLPDANRIGPANGGWAVAMETLTHERSNFAGGGDLSLVRVHAGERWGQLERTVAAVLADETVHSDAGNALPIGTPDAVIDLARRHGRLDDPTIRQRIAALYARHEALRWTGLRGQAAMRAGRTGGAESSVVYLGGVGVVRQCRDLVADIAGPAALLDATDIAQTILTAPCHGIQGGSEQVQRNVIGERMLGLPKEPQVDRETPFRDLKVGTQRD